MAVGHVLRQIDPSHSGMESNGGQQPRQSIGDSDRASRLKRLSLAQAEHLERQHYQTRRGAFGVGLERFQRSWRLLGEIKLARIKKSVEMRTRKLVVADRHAQRRDDLVPPRRRAAIELGNRVAPPL